MTPRKAAFSRKLKASGLGESDFFLNAKEWICIINGLNRFELKLLHTVQILLVWQWTYRLGIVVYDTRIYGISQTQREMTTKQMSLKETWSVLYEEILGAQGDSYFTEWKCVTRFERNDTNRCQGIVQEWVAELYWRVRK